MRRWSWIASGVVLLAALAALVLGLLAPSVVRSPVSLTGETTVQGRVLTPEQVHDVVERERLALAAVVTGQAPDPALGAGVIDAAHDAADLINPDGTPIPGSAESSLVGWRVYQEHAYVTVDYTLMWTQDGVESGASTPTLLRLAPTAAGWDVAGLEEMPDGGLAPTSKEGVAPWATEGVVWMILLALGVVSLSVAVLLRRSSWRVGLVFVLFAAAAILLFTPGAPDSASGGQGDGIVANALAEWPLTRPGGWLEDSGTGSSSLESYLAALRVFGIAAFLALAALAAALAPERGRPTPGSEGPHADEPGPEEPTPAHNQLSVP